MIHEHLSNKLGREKQHGRYDVIMIHGLHSTIISTRLSLPFLNDDDDDTQQQDEDNQTPGTHPKNQAHLLGVLGDPQRFTVIFAGRYKQEHREQCKNDTSRN